MSTATRYVPKSHAPPAAQTRLAERFGFPTDMEELADAVAVGAAAGARKATAKKWGKSVDAVDKAATGHPSNPVTRYREFYEACENPEALDTRMRVVRERKRCKDMSTMELVSEWNEIMGREPYLEADENHASQTYGRSRDLLRLAEAHEAEATAQVRLAAISRELHGRRIDPEEYR